MKLKTPRRPWRSVSARPPEQAGLKRNKAYKRHILTGKTRKNKRHLKAAALVFEGDLPRMKRLLPYG